MASVPEPVEYTESARSRLSSLTGVVGFGGAGLWLALATGGGLGERIEGGLLVAIAAFLLWAWISPPLGTRARLRLDADGVHAGSAFAAYRFDLPWSEVKGARVEYDEGQRLVVLDVADSEAGLAVDDEVARTTRRKWLAAVGSPYAIPAHLYGLAPEALEAEIERWLPVP